MPSRRERAPDDAAEEAAYLAGLGRAVERLRIDARLPREALAGRAGLSENTVAQIEEGVMEEPGWQTLRDLARGLSVEVPDLIRTGIELAPGEGGDMLRQRESEARDIDIEEVRSRAEAEEDQER
jgi:transcriptional regulator with XRE-family HTH domain